MMIIDIHAHLGDILFPEGGRLIEKKGVRQKGVLDVNTLPEILLFRGMENSNINLDGWFYKRSMKDMMSRNFAGTRENFRKSMDEAGISHSVSLPVPPYVNFSDLKPAAEKDPAIIPFTGIDFTKEYDFEAELSSDVDAGAKGIKLHPILQGEKLTSKRTFQAVEAFAPHGLPILMHTGVCTYYYDQRYTLREQPSYGELRYVNDLVRAFPNVHFILGHGVLFQNREAMEMLGGLKNVWVDTTFRSPKGIKEYIEAYGAERVLFGSDWPWGIRRPAVKCVRKSCRGDKALEKRIFFENAAELMNLNL